MKFKEQKSRMGTITHICDSPFVAIRESGSIYLNGDYTVEQLQKIVKRAQVVRGNTIPVVSIDSL